MATQTTDTINKVVITQSTCTKVQLLSKSTVFENLGHYTENSHNPLFDAHNLIHLLHSATNVVSKQLLSKSGNSDKQAQALVCHQSWKYCPCGGQGHFILRKKNLMLFYSCLTRLLPCTGASRTASWLFETWFGAAGGGRDGHSSVHSREGREGNVTGCSQQHHELLHVHTLGEWGSSRGDVKSMAREETESQTEGIK